ncbi:MAG TPA: ATP-binding protein [Fibrobacteraceae bacterium]|nr:ATP-binding protein [Fibrobacteraceae bacterium]
MKTSEKERPLQIAIASGKGGAGKTSVAVALLQANAERTRLVDCDVEEPDCHLFLDAPIVQKKPVTQLIPHILADQCRHCGRCVRACQFNALALAGDSGVMVFTELCHACGACAQICPAGAIEEVSTPVGELIQRQSEKGWELVTGILSVGHAAAPGVISAARRETPVRPVPFTLLDSPPGAACSLVTTLRDCDFALLVAEATPFGLHDLELAMETSKKLDVPCAVVVNRMRPGRTLIQDFCKVQGVPILIEIPEKREIAESIAAGGSLLDAEPDLRNDFRNLLDKCKQMINSSRAAHG